MCSRCLFEYPELGEFLGGCKDDLRKWLLDADASSYGACNRTKALLSEDFEGGSTDSPIGFLPFGIGSHIGRGS